MSFVAPASGTVVVETEAIVGLLSGSSVESLYWALFTHGTTTQVGYTTQAAESNNANIFPRIQATIRITGLTSGTAYAVDWAWASSSASETFVMTVQTVTGAAVGPAIMRVYAG